MGCSELVSPFSSQQGVARFFLNANTPDFDGNHDDVKVRAGDNWSAVLIYAFQWSHGKCNQTEE